MKMFKIVVAAILAFSSVSAFAGNTNIALACGNVVTTVISQDNVVSGLQLGNTYYVSDTVDHFVDKSGEVGTVFTFVNVKLKESVLLNQSNGKIELIGFQGKKAVVDILCR